MCVRSGGGTCSDLVSRTDDASFFMHDPTSQKSVRTSLVMYAHHKITDMAQWDLDMRECMRDLVKNRVRRLAAQVLC